jgi:hypothetical protein
MKSLLYYPGFEVRSEEWLKFALLYLDKLCPIIPEAGQPYLSDTFSTIRGETDLIFPNSPDYREGKAATLDAIELVEKMLQHPRCYGNTIGDVNYATNWRRPENHDYKLFRAKYTSEWRDFCLSEGLGVAADEGILLPRPLGLIYMSFLAHAISETRETPPITDYVEMDRISILTRKASLVTRKKTAIANSIVRLKLPGNIADLDIKDIIAHRESKGFKERLHAFHCELDKHIAEMEAGEADRTFLDSRGSIVREFSDEIVSLGVGVAGFSLGMWLLLSKPASTTEFAKEVVGGAALTVSSVICIRNTWKNTKTKRLTRKYLGMLDKMK